MRIEVQSPQCTNCSLYPFSIILHNAVEGTKRGGAQILESNNDVVIIMNAHKDKNREGDLKSVIRQQLQSVTVQLNFSLASVPRS